MYLINYTKVEGFVSRHGKGVQKAVHNVNNLIAPEIVAKCMDPVEQEKIDGLMLSLDGTENKNKLGANAILGVSMAVCKAGAAHKGMHSKDFNNLIVTCKTCTRCPPVQTHR